MVTPKRQAPYLHLQILELLMDGQDWSLSDIRKRLPSLVALSPADLARNPNRPNEPKWYSDLSNRLQKSRAGSLVAKGFVEAVGQDCYRITEAGCADFRLWNELSLSLADVNLEGDV